MADHRQDTLRNLLIAAAVFLLAFSILPRILSRFTPTAPPPSTSTSPAQPTSAVPSKPATDESAAWATPSAADGPAGDFTFVEAPGVQSLIIGAPPPTEPGKKQGRSFDYRMRVALSNVGASVDSVWLSDHAAHVGSVDRYQLLAPVEMNGSTLRSFAIERINIDSVDVDISDRLWTLSRHEPDSAAGESAEFSLDVQRSGQPLLRLTKTFELPRQAFRDGRHDLRCRLSVQNLASEPHDVVLTWRGGLGVNRLDQRVDDRVVDFGVRKPDGTLAPTRKRLSDAASTEDGTKTLFAITASNPTERLSWAAFGNTYFTCTIAPLAADGKSEAGRIASLSAFVTDRNSPSDHFGGIRLVTVSERIAPQGQTAYPLDLYVGEKDADAFRSVPEYSSRNYYFQVSQGYGYCTFSFLVTLMIWLLNHVYAVVPDYGIAIIVLVLIVRALLHPITKKGQVNMARMQRRMADLAPKIEEIKRKYANDKVRQNQELMALNINPAGQLMTCLPMLIQMPIWVALYLSLSHNVDMRHEAFLFTWVKDLTAQDALIPFSSSITVPLFGWVLTSFNLLPILVSLTQYIQMKLQPQPKPNPNLSEEQRTQQETMQKMMPMMSIMMLFIFYKMPSGLNLYVMSSSIFAAIEQWHIRKHIREQEEAGLLNPKETIRVDAKPVGRRLPGWMERLMQAAEEAKKQQRAVQKAKPRK